jgi:hypothetical protein
MLQSAQNSQTAQSSNLVFMRRRQVTDLILSLAKQNSANIPEKSQLLDALYLLPASCFIADDWHIILRQVTLALLQQENNQGARMPTHLTQWLTQIFLNP